MKIIFLDFDGVLNSEEFFIRERPEGLGASQVDPAAVQRLDRLVSATGAQIVISSTWRILYAIDEIIDILKQAGSKVAYKQVIDRTPSGNGRRGEEIKRWLDLVPERQAIDAGASGVEAYVILDDDSDMLPEQQDRFVHTNVQKGLTDRDVAEAVAILRMKI